MENTATSRDSNQAGKEPLAVSSVAEALGATPKDDYDRMEVLGRKVVSLAREQQEHQDAAARAGEALTLSIQELRTFGVSWARIGELLGISRELAYHRHGK